MAKSKSYSIDVSFTAAACTLSAKPAVLISVSSVQREKSATRVTTTSWIITKKGTAGELTCAGYAGDKRCLVPTDQWLIALEDVRKFVEENSAEFECELPCVYVPAPNSQPLHPPYLTAATTQTDYQPVTVTVASGFEWPAPDSTAPASTDTATQVAPIVVESMERTTQTSRATLPPVSIGFTQASKVSVGNERWHILESMCHLSAPEFRRVYKLPKSTCLVCGMPCRNASLHAVKRHG